jgi:site-specific recombinase XerD
MIESIFTREQIRSHLAESPMGEYLPALIQTLRTQRYAPDGMQRYVHAAATFGHWLTTQQLPVSAINEHLLARYIGSRGSRTIRTTGQAQRPQSTVGLHHLLQVLRDQGVIAPPVMAVPATPIDQVLAEYEQYPDRVHGAARLTRRKYQYFARQFLRAAFPTGELHWPALRAETITQVVQQEITGRRGFGRKHPGSAIRIFLRYLVTRGLIPAGLEAAVPSMRIWTQASLPEYFSEEEIARLLTASADGTAAGKRNYALLLLLARLGLRAQEAARLRLDDIDWAPHVRAVRYDLCCGKPSSASSRARGSGLAKHAG